MSAQGLVLSIFPGIDLLGRAFEEEGYCIVRGPDLLWGGDIRTFHPPAGVFEGVIGGPPCQRWARSHNLSRDKVRHPNLIPEFERVIREAHPVWFIMENVPAAPLPTVEDYHVDHHKLYDWEVGGVQRRYRRFSFGSSPPVLLAWPYGEKPPPGMLTLIAKHNGARMAGQRRLMPTLCGTNSSQRMRSGQRAIRGLGIPGKTTFSWQDYLIGFGLPADFDLPPFKQASKYQALGNGVPVAMGRAIARAVRRATAGAAT